jgi:hypothetical protein
MDQSPDFLHLRISGHQAYVSRVLEASHNSFLVRCPVDDGVPIVPDVGTPVDVGWMNVSGAVALHPAVATEYGDDGDSWTFRIQMLDEAVVVERRSHPRAAVRLDAEIAPVLGAPSVHATVLDLGAGGARLHVHDQLNVGDVVQLAIFPPDGEPVRLSARVIRVDGDTCAFTYELFWSGSVERLVEIAFQQAAAAAAP